MYKALLKIVSAAMAVVIACSVPTFGAEEAVQQTQQQVVQAQQQPEEQLIAEQQTLEQQATEQQIVETQQQTATETKKITPRQLEAKAQPSLFVEAPKPEQPKPEQPKTPVVKVPNYDFDIASYTTKYTGAESINRNYNIRLASDAVNGVILQPGQEFSFNDIILSKSNNGKMYKEAGVYINGEAATGIAGGICQISSTLYQAALYSGMNITRRQNHSLRVGYMAPGRDATASWGTIDFKFKNPLNTPVKIESVMNKGTIKIRFLAQEDPKIGEIKVNVTQADGVYTLTRTRADGKVDHTSRSKYKN